MASKLASLVVDLSVNSAQLRSGLDQAKGHVKGFSAGVASAMEGVSKMAGSVKRASMEISKAGLGLAAVASGAVAMAASVDKGIAAEVKNLRSAFADLSVPVATLVVPAMRDLAEHVRAVADWVAGLSPRTKEMAATFLQVAAAVGAASFVISKVAAAVGALAGVIGAITAGPFLLVVAGLAAVAAGALVLHKAWRENWWGMQEKTRSVVTAISGYWAAFKPWFSTLLDGFIDKWAAVEKAIARAGIAAKIATGQLSVGQWGAATRRSDGGIDRWAESMKGGGLGRAALDLGKSVKDGVLAGAAGLKAEFDLLMKGFSLDNGGRAGRHGLAAGPITSGAKGMNRGIDLKAFADELDKASIAVKAWAELLGKGRGKGEGSGGENPLEQQMQDEADAREGMVGDLQRKAEEYTDALKGVLIRAAGTLTSKMGDVGQIINAAVQGFQTAGPWGAIIAVIAELVSRLQVFTDFTDMLNKKLFAALAELNEALKPLFSALTAISTALDPIREVIHSIIRMVLQAIQPIFEIIAKVLNAVGKGLEPLAAVFDELGSGLGALFSAVGAVSDALHNLEPVTVSLGMTFKIIGAALSFAMLGILGIALGIVRAVQAIMGALGQNTAGIKATGDSIEAKGNAMADSLKKFDLFAGPVAKAGDAAEKLTDKFNEMLTNIPSGYKIRGAQFNADLGIGGGPGGGSPGGSTGAGSPPNWGFEAAVVTYLPAVVVAAVAAVAAATDKKNETTYDQHNNSGQSTGMGQGNDSSGYYGDQAASDAAEAQRDAELAAADAAAAAASRQQDEDNANTEARDAAYAASINITNVNVYANDIFQLQRELQEVATMQQARRSRNPY